MKKDQWDAKEYAKYSKGQAKWANELINMLSLSGNESFLDIGCGDGKHSYKVANLLQNGYVTAIDNSQKMIELAQKRYQKKNLEYLLMDATSLKLNKKYDVVFSNAVLHWIEDHLSLLKNLKSYLNPNAKIIFSMGGEGNAKDILKIATELINSEKYREYFINFDFPYYFYNIKEYRYFLNQSGYNEKRIKLVKKDMIHQDKEALKGWIRTTWFPYLTMLPVDTKEDFIEELANSYILKYSQSINKNICVKMIRLEAEATI